MDHVFALASQFSSSELGGSTKAGPAVLRIMMRLNDLSTVVETYVLLCPYISIVKLEPR